MGKPAAQLPPPGRLLAIVFGPCIGIMPAAAQSTPATAPAGQTCVQAVIAGHQPLPYNCLNQELQQQAQGTGQAAPAIPLGSTSPSNATGTFNEQSLKQQYGQNYGKSVTPYRPPAPVFNSPAHSP